MMLEKQEMIRYLKNAEEQSFNAWKRLLVLLSMIQNETTFSSLLGVSRENLESLVGEKLLEKTDRKRTPAAKKRRGRPRKTHFLKEVTSSHVA